MTEIHHEIILPFTVEQMYQLVIDVEKYPEFLPYCSSLIVKSKKERAYKTVSVAEMTVGYKLIKETMCCQILENAEKFEVITHLISGPFSHLENNWTFESQQDGGCKVIFNLDYRFSSKMLEAIVGKAFDKFFSLFATSFEKRAYAIYQPLNA